MAVVNSGFKGKLNESTFAGIHSLVSVDAVAGAADWAVTQGTGRQISVAAGRAFARGVLSDSDSAITASVNTPTNGQWFLAVRRINWVTRAVTIELLASSTTSTATPSTVPTLLPSGMENSPGVRYDHKLAWVWANSANTNLVVVDLRNRPADVLRAGDASARDAFYAANLATAAGRDYLLKSAATWFRTDLGYDTRWNGLGWVGRVGLVPIRPSAVAHATQSIQADNSVLFNGTPQNQAVQGLFSSDFDDYVIKWKGYANQLSQVLGLRLTQGATVAGTGTDYVYEGSMSRSSGPTFQRWGSSGTSFFDLTRLDNETRKRSHFRAELMSPAISSESTGITFQAAGLDSGGLSVSGSGFHNVAASYDGIAFAQSDALLYGVLRVYGYNKG